MRKPNKQLTLLTLVAINITAILSLNSIAYMSTIGLQSVLFFAGAALFFFIPSALVSAELSSMMSSDNGGVYTWVSRAFGKKTGLVAIWMEWFNNVISFPATLASLVATFAYAGFPTLATNPKLMFIIMLGIYWAISLFNCLPLSKTSKLNIIGASLGMLLPGTLLIACGVYWFHAGQLQIHFQQSHEWLPTASFATFALFVKVLSSYSGIQAVAYHARNVERPRINIPVSMVITVVIIFLLTTFATVSLAAIVPNAKLNAMNGLIEGISLVLNYLHLGALSIVITICICIGMLAALSTWVLGPARAIQEVAANQLMPKLFAKTNAYGMPTAVLLVQAIIGSVLASVFLFMPSIQSAFALLIALTSQFTVMMFILVFCAAIRLRFTEPQTPRLFRVGRTGNSALLFWASLGIIACACGFFLGLFPPKFSQVQDMSWYVTLMIIADIVIISIPFIYIWIKHRHWKLVTE